MWLQCHCCRRNYSYWRLTLGWGLSRPHFQLRRRSFKLTRRGMLLPHGFCLVPHLCARIGVTVGLCSTSYSSIQQQLQEPLTRSAEPTKGGTKQEVMTSQRQIGQWKPPRSAATICRLNQLQAPRDQPPPTLQRHPLRTKEPTSTSAYEDVRSRPFESYYWDREQLLWGREELYPKACTSNHQYRLPKESQGDYKMQQWIRLSTQDTAIGVKGGQYPA